MENCSITQVEDFSFGKLKHLKLLSLSQNSLTKISNNIIAGADNVVDLIFTSNEIDTIEEEAFKSTELRYIGLRSNKLQSIAEKVFIHAPRLEIIDISSNLLTRIGDVHFPRGVFILALGHNPFERVNLQRFATYQQLEYLELRNTTSNIGFGNRKIGVEVLHLDNSPGFADVATAFKKLKHSKSLKQLSINVEDFTCASHFEPPTQWLPNLKDLQVNECTFKF